MIDWVLRMGRTVKPWMIAVCLAAGFAEACSPAYYGPPPAPMPVYYGPPPALQECQQDADCTALHGEGWYCDVPEAAPDADAAAAWGVCRPIPPESP
jgi:hypothetical protein